MKIPRYQTGYRIPQYRIYPDKPLEALPPYTSLGEIPLDEAWLQKELDSLIEFSEEGPPDTKHWVKGHPAKNPTRRDKGEVVICARCSGTGTYFLSECPTCRGIGKVRI